jgi:hypothetical protein
VIGGTTLQAPTLSKVKFLDVLTSTKKEKSAGMVSCLNILQIVQSIGSTGSNGVKELCSIKLIGTDSTWKMVTKSFALN